MSPKSQPRRLGRFSSMPFDKSVLIKAIFVIPLITTILALQQNSYLSKFTHAPIFVSSPTSQQVLNPLSHTKNHVTIWSPPPCDGSFVSERAQHSKKGFPYAVIREAVIDRRPVSHRQYRESYNTNAFQRIILYISVHLSVSLTRENAIVQLVTSGSQPVPGIAVRVDYVQRVDPFLVKMPYQPGDVTKRGHEVSEWQLAISLAPKTSMIQSDFDKHVQDLASFASIVKLELGLNRFDHLTIKFNPTFHLACATAWERPDVFPSLDHLRLPTCHTDIQNTHGAIALSGSALYGKKKIDRRYYAEVAHFGARALGGPIKFDAVAMGVVVNNSVSDRRFCADEACVERMNKKNQQLLEDVREAVELELQAVGLDRSLWRNLILIPLCRLGSDSSGTELADPCKQSHRYGQYHATFFSYAMLAPYFKWAASYDMDEFFAISPRDETFPTGRADAVLDEVNKHARSYMYFTWLNFIVRPNSSRSLTRELLSSRALELRHKDNYEDFDCLRLTRDPTGKSAVRCDTGVGFTIHRPIIRNSALPGLLAQIQGEVRMKNLRAWHARLGGGRGECIYVDKNETIAMTG